MHMQQQQRMMQRKAAAGAQQRPAVRAATRPVGRALLRAATTEAPTAQDEFIEVDLVKPLGVKFARGNDGGAYVSVVDETVGSIDERIQVRGLWRAQRQQQPSRIGAGPAWMVWHWGSHKGWHQAPGVGKRGAGARACKPHACAPRMGRARAHTPCHPWHRGTGGSSPTMAHVHHVCPGVRARARTLARARALSSHTQPGDKIVKVSASFGGDVWDAQNYGQVWAVVRAVVWAVEQRCRGRRAGGGSRTSPLTFPHLSSTPAADHVRHPHPQRLGLHDAQEELRQHERTGGGRGPPRALCHPHAVHTACRLSLVVGFCQVWCRLMLRANTLHAGGFVPGGEAVQGGAEWGQLRDWNKGGPREELRSCEWGGV